MYSFHSRVRFSELEHRRGCLSCASIINYFQDCSTFQSEDLHIGLNYLQEECRVWMLNSWHLKLAHPAMLGDNITIGTWAYAFRGFYGYRNFVMKNEREEVLAAADSIWVYLDTETGKPVKIPKDGGGYNLEPAYPMEHVSRKLDAPDFAVPQSAFPVVKANIDSYHHVNNGQYIKMAEEFVPEDFMVESMQVEYKMQAVLGDIIVPLVSEDKNSIHVVIANEEHKAFAVVKFHGSRLLV